MASLKRHLAWTVLTSFGVMGINFATGVLVSRLLSPSGRGELAAINTWTQILGWAAALGFYESMTYLRARGHHPPQRILGSGLVVVLVCGTLGFLVAQWLLPGAMAAQRPELLPVARAFMVGIFVSIALSTLNAMITGDQQFHVLNLLRLVQPLIYLAGLLALWALGGLSVVRVLCLSLGCDLAVAIYLSVRLVRRTGIGLPSLAVLKEGLVYGLKLQGALFAALANGRLDLMLMPALLTAAQVGLYSVATNLSSLVVTLLGSASLVVFPAAVRAGDRDGLRMIARTSRLVFFGGGAFAIVFAATAPVLLRLIYGDAFAGAVLPLQILLPGVVLMACTKIIDSGLQAVNRPMCATYAQIAGLAVTLGGLWLTLRPLGITGAALTSTLSYATSFAVALWYLSREPHFATRDAFSVRGFISDATASVERVRERIPGLRVAPNAA